MNYDTNIVWQPIYLSKQEGFDFQIILDRKFAKKCLDKKLTPEQQNSFNYLASNQITRDKIRTPCSFYKDTIFVQQINLDSDRLFYIPEIYGNNPLDVSIDKPIVYQSNNFDSRWHRDTIQTLFDFWVRHINSFD